MPSLEDELEDLKDDLEDSEDTTDDAPEPLPESERTLVEARLDNVEDCILRIQNPSKNPSLAPADAGSVDNSVRPVSLQDYAVACKDLAIQAWTESGKPTPDDDMIGTKLKTIQHLLPGYRNKAGIN